jgi:hypothetical protein
MKHAMMLLFLIAAPLAFAQTWCEQDCCDKARGQWDSDFDSCDYPDSSYGACVDEWCTQSKSSVQCCGSAIVLASIGGLAFISRNGVAP